MLAKSIMVKGIVQGVGFRPFVYQLAANLSLKGTVKNSSFGVSIHLEGSPVNIDCFLQELNLHPPQLSHIEEILIQPAEIQDYDSFNILKSTFTNEALTLLSPDIAMCPECLEDIRNIKDTRRSHYAFTNCTNCGPRFSIIKALPYDRPFTTMEDFKMCPACKTEYENPLDRRFHAQPTCCTNCGPELTLLDHKGIPLVISDPVLETRQLLKAGYIVAVKGIGGFHLICDASSSKAISTLRHRKKRPTKPLALMLKDRGTVLQYCCLSDEEEKVLLGPKKPILLLKKKNKKLPYTIAFDNPNLGVMLPYTPLHHMLFDDSLVALVATSANHSGMPMLYENHEALEQLATIADYYLLHNRTIHIPVDDSVVKVVLEEERVIRPARGYAPYTFHVDSDQVLALGSEFKNTFCISKQNYCFMSQYIGDIDTVETLRHLTHIINHLKTLYNIVPQAIAYDHHPHFWHKDYVEAYTGKKIGVYHHHAHIVSCLAENHIEDTVIGIAFDGVGYGSDGRLWGSEFLICNKKEFQRVGHLNYFKMPGGDRATVWPWRMAISLLYESFGEALDTVLPSYVTSNETAPLLSMLKNNIRSPLCCSMGRLFDGVAALLGFSSSISYEAEACIYLENLASSSPATEALYLYNLTETDGIWVIDYTVLIRDIVKDLQSGTLTCIISRKFHNTLCVFTLDLCQHLRQSFKLNKVALSGGVFQNELLFTRLHHLLISNDFDVITHKLVPCNDSGLSLGQLVIASELIKE
ncbi:MAG: carbamoyltransferase HypF [Clostridia bacterium]|jgi:hydrogenase maturation protein HypF|nr:carbamoyltransferase HypF [Clostridia bacterium]